MFYILHYYSSVAVFYFYIVIFLFSLASHNCHDIPKLILNHLRWLDFVVDGKVGTTVQMNVKWPP